MSDTTRLIVVRHGETRANVEGRWQGHRDWPLTEVGVAQAEAVAQRLEGCGFSSLYSSDLGRALHTARIIANRSGHAIVADERLRERHLGVFQGLTRAEMETQYPEEWRLYRTAGPDYAIPGGESARQRLERNVSCLEEIGLDYPGETVVVVTHGGVLIGLLYYVLGIPLESPRRFKIWNVGVNVFSFESGSWQLDTWGDVSHLGDLAFRGDS